MADPETMDCKYTIHTTVSIKNRADMIITFATTRLFISFQVYHG